MRAFLLAAMMVVIGASGARASYLGDSIAGTLSNGPNMVTQTQYRVVAPFSVGYSDGIDTYNIAFRDGITFTITDMVNATTSGFGTTFKDLTNAFTSVSLVSSSFAPGLTSSFTNGVINVNWTGTSRTGTYTAVFNVTTAVPEPASLALLGMGVVGIAAVKRRREG